MSDSTTRPKTAFQGPTWPRAFESDVQIGQVLTLYLSGQYIWSPPKPLLPCETCDDAQTGVWDCVIIFTRIRECYVSGFVLGFYSASTFLTLCKSQVSLFKEVLLSYPIPKIY